MKLVDKIEMGELKPFGRALLPISLTKSANYELLYATSRSTAAGSMG